jgi:hypothetical protein
MVANTSGRRQKTFLPCLNHFFWKQQKKSPPAGLSEFHQAFFLLEPSFSPLERLLATLLLPPPRYQSRVHRFEKQCFDPKCLPIELVPEQCSAVQRQGIGHDIP